MISKTAVPSGAGTPGAYVGTSVKVPGTQSKKSRSPGVVAVSIHGVSSSGDGRATAPGAAAGGGGSGSGRGARNPASPPKPSGAPAPSSGPPGSPRAGPTYGANGGKSAW